MDNTFWSPFFFFFFQISRSFYSWRPDLFFGTFLWIFADAYETSNARRGDSLDPRLYVFCSHCCSLNHWGSCATRRCVMKYLPKPWVVVAFSLCIRLGNYSWFRSMHFCALSRNEDDFYLPTEFVHDAISSNVTYWAVVAIMWVQTDIFSQFYPNIIVFRTWRTEKNSRRDYRDILLKSYTNTWDTDKEEIHNEDEKNIELTKLPKRSCWNSKNSKTEHWQIQLVQVSRTRK